MSARLQRTNVELGTGTGANTRYYPPGVHVIGIQPNPAMQPRRAEAERFGVALEIRWPIRASSPTTTSFSS